MPSQFHNGGGWIRPTSRLAIYLRDQFLCVWCGANLTRRPAKDVTLDHVVPREQGGTNDARNLVTACKSCNASRGTRDVRESALYLACSARGVAYDDTSLYCTEAMALVIAGDVRATIARVTNARRRTPNRDLARAIIGGRERDPRPAVQAKRTRRARLTAVRQASPE